MSQIQWAALAASVLIGASAAGPALACLPPLPQTEEQRATSDLNRQTYAWDNAPFVYEVEIVETFMSPSNGPQLVPVDPRSQRLHIRFQPVRTVRGEGEGQMVEMAYPVGCNAGIDGPSVVGARYLAYALRPMTQPVDVIELLPVERITHTASRQALSED